MLKTTSALIEMPEHNSKLEEVLYTVHKKHYQNSLCVEDIHIRWGLPNHFKQIRLSSESADIEACPVLSQKFNQAKLFIQSAETKQAIGLLKGICNTSYHYESAFLLMHLLKQAQDSEWQQYATLCNQQHKSLKAVPASCYYTDTHTIEIHHHLAKCNPPAFVLKYLVFHEMNHALYPTHHPKKPIQSFLDQELLAPARDKALTWLEKKNYPTIRNGIYTEYSN